jgi:hypothetical protein
VTRDIEFRIDAWTPETIPQDRLGQYLIELARLYGENGSVHFEKLRKGSAVLVSRVDEPARPKVERRLREILAGEAPCEAVEAYRRIDDMLADDNAIGTVRGFHRGIVVRFPGRTRPKPIEYAAIREKGVLEGEIVRIGGLDRTKHITLQSGDTVYVSIETNRETAQRLGALLFGPTVRLHGTGNWRRDRDGAWRLDRFVVEEFEVLDDTSLADATAALRRIGGSEWGGLEDLLGALQEQRAGGRRR